jgi:ABC-type multidrug transport system permease subunit
LNAQDPDEALVKSLFDNLHSLKARQQNGTPKRNVKTTLVSSGGLGASNENNTEETPEIGEYSYWTSDLNENINQGIPLLMCLFLISLLSCFFSSFFFFFFFFFFFLRS